MCRIQQFSTYFQAISIDSFWKCCHETWGGQNVDFPRLQNQEAWHASPVRKPVDIAATLEFDPSRGRNRNGTWTTRLWKTHLFLSDLFHRLAYRKALNNLCRTHLSKAFPKTVTTANYCTWAPTLL
jgi:hypothetical protein